MTENVSGFGDYFKNPNGDHGLTVNSIFNKYKMSEVRSQHKSKKREVLPIANNIPSIPSNQGLMVVPFKK